MKIICLVCSKKYTRTIPLTIDAIDSANNCRTISYITFLTLELRTERFNNDCLLVIFYEFKNYQTYYLQHVSTAGLKWYTSDTISIPQCET